MPRNFAKRQVHNAMNALNGAIVTAINNSLAASVVLVYRPEKNKWESLFSLLNIKGEAYIVLLLSPARPSKIWPTIVKLFVHKISRSDHNGGNTGNTKSNSSHIVDTSLNFKFVRVFFSTFSTNVRNFENDFISTLKTVLQQSNDHKFYTAAKSADFTIWSRRGHFFVPKLEAAGHRVYSPRFCDHIKNVRDPSAYAKSRMDIQAIKDKVHVLFTHVPTVWRLSQCFLFATYIVLQNFVIFLHDVTQPYIQSKPSLYVPSLSSSLFCSPFRLIIYFASIFTFTVCLKPVYSGPGRITIPSLRIWRWVWLVMIRVYFTRKALSGTTI